MDFAGPVTYRGVSLNTTTVGPNGRISGCQLNRVVPGAAVGVGYTEKRALDDGNDASDVYLGTRRFILQGTLYGSTHAELWDLWQQLRAAFTPTGAYTENPTYKGYQPLVWRIPTENVGDFPEGYREVYMRMRPLAQPESPFARDALGGEPSLGLSLNWEAALEAIDPRTYINETQLLPFGPSSATVTEGDGELINRGDYSAPLSFTLFVPSSAAAGVLTLNAAGSQMEVTIPNSASDQTLYYDGNKRFFFQEVNGVTSLRMDLFELLNDTPHPKVPPGGDTYDFDLTVALPGITSFLYYTEAFA